MIVKDVTRYPGSNGTVDTMVILPMEGEPLKRIWGENGMWVTDGENVVPMLDIPAADLDKWYEIEPPETEVDEDPDATEADYIAALNELGVDTSEEE